VKRCKSNRIAQKVKIADLEDNMDIRRFNVLKEEDLKRLNKYLRAWKYITKEEN
jgi:translation elongation factor EF-Ts